MNRSTATALPLATAVASEEKKLNALLMGPGTKLTAAISCRLANAARTCFVSALVLRTEVDAAPDGSLVCTGEVNTVLSTLDDNIAETPGTRSSNWSRSTRLTTLTLRPSAVATTGITDRLE